MTRLRAPGVGDLELMVTVCTEAATEVSFFEFESQAVSFATAQLRSPGTSAYVGRVVVHGENRASPRSTTVMLPVRVDRPTLLAFAKHTGNQKPDRKHVIRFLSDIVSTTFDQLRSLHP